MGKEPEEATGWNFTPGTTIDDQIDSLMEAYDLFCSRLPQGVDSGERAVYMALSIFTGLFDDLLGENEYGPEQVLGLGLRPMLAFYNNFQNRFSEKELDEIHEVWSSAWEDSGGELTYE